MGSCCRGGEMQELAGFWSGTWREPEAGLHMYTAHDSVRVNVEQLLEYQYHLASH